MPQSPETCECERPGASSSVNPGGLASTENGCPADGAVWLLVINNETYEPIELCRSRDSAFRLLHEYVAEQWEGTFGEEPIDSDPQQAVERFFDVGPVGYTLEERALW